MTAHTSYTCVLHSGNHNRKAFQQLVFIYGNNVVFKASAKLIAYLSNFFFISCRRLLDKSFTYFTKICSYPDKNGLVNLSIFGWNVTSSPPPNAHILFCCFLFTMLQRVEAYHKLIFVGPNLIYRSV